MMGMGGGSGGGRGGGHMATCPLCKGTGRVPVQVAAQMAPPPEAGADPVAALSAAMMSKPRGGGGHGGHGG